jgi:hypothetical protein
MSVGYKVIVCYWLPSVKVRIISLWYKVIDCCWLFDTTCQSQNNVTVVQGYRLLLVI